MLREVRQIVDSCGVLSTDDRLRGQWSSRDKRDERDEDMVAASNPKYPNGQRGKMAVINGDDQRRRWCRASAAL